MRFAVGFHDGDFDEKEREERVASIASLDEADYRTGARVKGRFTARDVPRKRREALKSVKPRTFFERGATRRSTSSPASMVSSDALGVPCEK